MSRQTWLHTFQTGNRNDKKGEVKWDSSDGIVGESERYFNHLQTAPEWDENVGSLVSVFTGLLGEK